MDGGSESLIKVWSWAALSICFCYYFIQRIPPAGILRFSSIFLIVSSFVLLPINLSLNCWPHLVGATVYYLVWLANFKLLLFSLGHGPLSHNTLSLIHFLFIALLPINTKQTNTQTCLTSINPVIPRSSVSYAVKVLLLVLIILAYDYTRQLHPYMVLFLAHLNFCFEMELVMAASAVPARLLARMDLDRQFNEPYLATSLQDFWSRRWNLVSSDILRLSVHRPVRRAATRALGTEWGLAVAFVATFSVSGLMHDAMYCYLTREPPTWEATAFFFIHGVCTAAEVAAKRAVGGRWRLRAAVTWPLTQLFVFVSTQLVLFAPLRRYGLHRSVLNEYNAVSTFIARDLFGVK